MSGATSMLVMFFWAPFGFSILSITGFLVSYCSNVVSHCVGGSKTVLLSLFPANWERQLYPSRDRGRYRMGPEQSLAISMNPAMRPTQSDLFDRLMVLRGFWTAVREEQLYQPPTPNPSPFLPPLAFGRNLGRQTDTPRQSNPGHIEAWPPGPARVKHKNADCNVINTLSCTACMYSTGNQPVV